MNPAQIENHTAKTVAALEKVRADEKFIQRAAPEFILDGVSEEWHELLKRAKGCWIRAVTTKFEWHIGKALLRPGSGKLKRRLESSTAQLVDETGVRGVGYNRSDAPASCPFTLPCLFPYAISACSFHDSSNSFNSTPFIVGSEVGG